MKEIDIVYWGQDDGRGANINFLEISPAVCFYS